MATLAVLSVILVTLTGCGQAGVSSRTVDGPAIILDPERSLAEGDIAFRYRRERAAPSPQTVDMAVIVPLSSRPHPWVVLTVVPEDPDVGPAKQYLLSGFNRRERIIAFNLEACPVRASCGQRFFYRFEYVAGKAPVEIQWQVDGTNLTPARNIVVSSPDIDIAPPVFGQRRSGDAVGFDTFQGNRAAATQRHYRLAYRPDLVGGRIRFLASPLAHSGNRLPQWLDVVDDVTGDVGKIVERGIVEHVLHGRVCESNLCAQTFTVVATLDAPHLQHPASSWNTEWALRLDVRRGSDPRSPPADLRDLAFVIVEDQAQDGGSGL